MCLNYEVKMLRNLKALYKYTDRFLTRERQTEKYKERETETENKRETNKERTVLIIKIPEFRPVSLILPMSILFKC